MCLLFLNIGHMYAFIAVKGLNLSFMLHYILIFEHLYNVNNNK